MAVAVVIAIEVRERKRTKSADDNEDAERAATIERVMPDGSVCCGLHLVCEKESLLNETDQVVYYDDEQLDSMRGINAADYTPDQEKEFDEVFRTMREEDVVGWVKSLQLREIELPFGLRDEVLLVVQEQRLKSRKA